MNYKIQISRETEINSLDGVQSIVGVITRSYDGKKFLLYNGETCGVDNSTFPAKFVAAFKDVMQYASQITDTDATEAAPEICDTENYSPYQKTVAGMMSANYKERFKAEYQQLKIRTDKLNAFCNRIEAAQDCMNNSVEEPKHDCSFDLLKHQLHIMREYLHCLEIRAVIEGVEL